MRKDKRIVIQSIVILELLVAFVTYSNHSTNKYNELLEVCNEKTSTLEEKETYLEDLESSYSDLENDFAELKKDNKKLKTKLKTVKLPTYKYTEDEVYLMAQCVEAEAGYYEGHRTSQKYVAQVILNRLHNGEFPDTIREVIYQKKDNIPQFSVAYDGAMNREVQPETLANVYSVLVNGTDLPEYVCYFYSAYVKENWVNTLPIYDTVEGTVFAYEVKEDY